MPPHPSPVPQASSGMLGLTPGGRVHCLAEEGPLADAFGASEPAGLVFLASRKGGFEEDGTVLFWRALVEHYLRALCHLPEGTGETFALDVPDEATLAEWILNTPPMRGAEYLSRDILGGIWTRLEAWVRTEAHACGGVGGFLDKNLPTWSRVGRVTLHLAENKGDEALPFAFMASYAAGVSASGQLRQVPLGRALQEFSGARNKAVLLKLLQPLHRAAQACPVINELVESGDVFHPLAWSPQEAYAFLQNLPACEDAGLLVRLPNWWRKRARRPQVTATIGDRPGAGLGLGALLDFHLEVVIDGIPMSPAELKSLMRGDDGLVLFRGQWIEVDRDKLRQALEHWKALQAKGGLSLLEGMRMLAGAPADLEEGEELPEQRDWAFARPGAWLAGLLSQLSQPEPLALPAGLKATLRPYQVVGLDWLWFCARAGLGSCLADDMGLGKTIQVLAALLRRKEAQPGSPPCLLVVPASLIGNWKAEAARFAPSLSLFIAHRSEAETAVFSEPASAQLAAIDLVVTTYGMLSRLGWLARIQWGWVILDEAQAIKNHATRQSKAARKLAADARMVLTGTPVENHLGDLWSLFDFINPGLLGSATQFEAFIRQLGERNNGHYGPLRRLVAPYILRRLKTDKSIIADLPEKTEMRVYCGLSAAQVQLYQQTALALERELEVSQGISRRGLVLAYLMRFKQICNHPDQLTKAGGFDPAGSAKFGRLASLCEEIASRGEKALVFTQFREMTVPLQAHLSRVFGRGGLVLHGGTGVKDRMRLVGLFQHEDGPPFFVLSLKAGGTGLNLTAASHVIHFDRWWNPAVENQATDRAFRIGQRRNVLVHKFITRGTLEEKIDALISSKQGTADAVLGGEAEKALTEMDDKELLDFIRLDLHHAQIQS